MRAIGHFIGGREVKGNSGRTADVFEPVTGDVQAKVALASKAEVRAAVENARAAQPELTEVLSVAGLTPVGSGGKVGGLPRCRKSL